MAVGLTQPLNRNECQKCFLEGKGGQCVGHTTLPPSYADCLEIWEPQLPGTLRACPGMQWDCFTLYSRNGCAFLDAGSCLVYPTVLSLMYLFFSLLFLVPYGYFNYKLLIMKDSELVFIRLTFFSYSFASILYHCIYGCIFCMLLYNFVYYVFFCSVMYYYCYAMYSC